MPLPQSISLTARVIAPIKRCVLNFTEVRVDHLRSSSIFMITARHRTYVSSSEAFVKKSAIIAVVATHWTTTHDKCNPGCGAHNFTSTVAPEIAEVWPDGQIGGNACAERRKGAGARARAPTTATTGLISPMWSSRQRDSGR